MQIERGAVHGSLIDFEIAGVDDHAERRSNRQGHAIHGTVRHGDEFNLVGADFNEAAREHFAERRGLQQSRFVEAFFYQCQRETRSVHRNIQIAQDVGQRANVIFVAVRQHNGPDVRAILLQIRDIRNHQIDAQKFRFGEHHARVDDDDVVTEPQRHHVHAEFAEAAERNGGEGMRGLTCCLTQ